MGRCKHRVGNVRWYERQGSSQGGSPSEIRAPNQDVRNGYGTGRRTKGCYLGRLKLVFVRKINVSCKRQNKLQNEEGTYHSERFLRVGFHGE